MANYPIHEQAARDALTLIGRLPPDTVWSFFICENDNPVTPGTFNVYAPRSQWGTLTSSLLTLHQGVVDEDDDFTTFRFNALLVSIMENPND